MAKLTCQIISGRTIDRILIEDKREGTKVCRVLKSQIPIRTFADWNDSHRHLFRMDNGSEFINSYVKKFCQKNNIEF
ncbi:hypothetical protein J7K25_04435 [bacterium]|nr:hypothetical protein [bacterium]